MSLPLGSPQLLLFTSVAPQEFPFLQAVMFHDSQTIQHGLKHRPGAAEGSECACLVSKVSDEYQRKEELNVAHTGKKKQKLSVIIHNDQLK